MTTNSHHSEEPIKATQNPEKVKSKWRKWGWRCGKYLLFVIVFLALLEWVLRWMIPGFHTASLPQKTISSHTRTGFQYDRDLMWYWDELPDPSNGINVFGFRYTKPMSQAKPPGIIRAIGFGDSQTYGADVSADETFIAYAQTNLGEDWEFLNAGISGYRSLNIFRLMRLKMLPFSPDIFVVNAMMWDSPAEDGQLHQPTAGSITLQMREFLWNSRLNYVFQMVLRRLGIGYWEDLPWPVHLHKVRADLQQQARGGNYGNHQQILRWASERGITVLFMEYPYMKGNGSVGCHAKAEDFPSHALVFKTCDVLQNSGHKATDLFLDTNHLKPLGAKVIGERLAVKMQSLQ